ncbi:MAG: Gfo/Idh/MocA family oxidoreductase [Clostridiales Family XIII bacterium]|jgi:predicted dehydrogenase|nr:Gfo/Idh/MocA family oxidoreductase [Clostridiales Family XIII bacterium]
MAKKKINIAIIGRGFMGRAHSFAWANAAKFFDIDADIVLKAAYSRNKDEAKKFASKWGWEEVLSSSDELLERKDIDVVDIVTPTIDHAPLAIKAAENNKHIFCEKPAATTYKDAREMAVAAENAGVVNYLNHNYRRVPAVAFAKKLIDEGKIGDIYHFRGAYLQDWIMDSNFPLTWHLQDKYAGGGPLFDLGSHSVDLARFLVGEISSVSAKLRTFIRKRPLPGSDAGTFTAGERDSASSCGEVTVDDAAFFVVDFENGALGSFDVSRFAGGRKNWNDFEIYGSKGSLAFNFESMNELKFCELDTKAGEQGFKTISVTTPDHPYAGLWWGPGHVLGYENPFFHAVADFINAIARGKKISPNLSDGASNIRILEAVKKSADEKKAVDI